MANSKQVMDIRPNSEGISLAESNEQQRNWSEDFLRKKSNDPLANYDPTRAHLNFEVTRGGVIQPIDKSKSIMQKMADNLAVRGIKDPNARENVRRRQNTLAQVIFGGSRERMNTLAFGSQTLDLNKGADNSHLSRSRDIEEWAKDVYSFVARRFGEENIVGFYVHLDETNVHAHRTLIPMDKEKNCISWRSVFGQNKYEMGKIFSMLHDDFSKEVGKKWGMERGSNKAETGARHRSTEEYKRDLINQVQELENTREGLLGQIRRMEIKQKGLTTMIANLQARKEKINEEIDLIARQFGEDGQDKEQLARRMTELRKQMEDIDRKISEKQRMLDKTENVLADAKAKQEGLRQEHRRMSEIVGDDIDREAKAIHSNIVTTYYKMMAESFQPVIPKLSNEHREVLRDSGFYDLTDSPQHVITCALFLAINYIKEATTYAESCGGRGGNMTGWGRDKDDGDERWWMRCIARAAAMVKPLGRKKQIKIGR